jgi:flagellar export protein FliJ
MVQFNFRLQSVLEYRRALVDRLQIVLSDRQRQLRDCERQLAELHALMEQGLNSLSEQEGEHLDVGRATQVTIHVDHIEREIAHQVEVLEQVRAEYERTREELLELEKSARTLERLRDRQHDEWATAELRREQAQLNELAAIFHQRIKDD